MSNFEVLLIPLIFFFPGFVLYQILLRKKKNIDFCEKVYLWILGSILLTGWVALTLAELGLFSLSWLLLITTSILLLLGFIYRKKFEFKLQMKWRINKSSIVLITLLIISTALFFHPFEWILGGNDAGVLVNIGVNIAKTGSITIPLDAMIADIPRNLVKDFYYDCLRSCAFAGFYYNIGSELIFPQFYHLFPSWIAISYSTMKMPNFLYITPFFGIMSIASIFFFTKKAFDIRVAIIASVLLAISLPQIWHARYPGSEMLTQFLIFGGLFTLYEFLEKTDPYYGILSALSFAEVLFIRIDGFIVIALVFVLIGYLRFTGKLKKRYLWFVLPFIVVSSHAFLHTLTISRMYTFSILKSTFSIQANSFVELINFFGILNTGVYLILIIISLMILDKFTKTTISKFSKFSLYEGKFRIALSAIILIFFIYQGLVRPLSFNYWASLNTISLESWVQQGPYLDPLNLVRLALYLSPFCILLGIAGMTQMLLKDRKNTFFVMFGLVFCLLFLDTARIVPILHWWSRRYIPVVIPFFIIAASFFLGNMLKRRRKRIVRSLGVILLFNLVIYSFLVNLPTLNYIELKGIINQTDQFASSFTSQDVIMFDGGMAGNLLPVPLKFIYGLNVINLRHEDWRLHQDSLDFSIVKSMIEHWISREKDIYIINPKPETMEAIYHMNYTLVRKEQAIFSFPMLGHNFLWPLIIHQIDFSVIIFEIEPQKDTNPKTLSTFQSFNYENYNISLDFVSRYPSLMHMQTDVKRSLKSSVTII